MSKHAWSLQHNFFILQDIIFISSPQKMDHFLQSHFHIDMSTLGWSWCKLHCQNCKEVLIGCTHQCQYMPGHKKWYVVHNVKICFLPGLLDHSLHIHPHTDKRIQEQSWHKSHCPQCKDLWYIHQHLHRQKWLRNRPIHCHSQYHSYISLRLAHTGGQANTCTHNNHSQQSKSHWAKPGVNAIWLG